MACKPSRTMERPSSHQQGLQHLRRESPSLALVSKASEVFPGHHNDGMDHLCGKVGNLAAVPSGQPPILTAQSARASAGTGVLHSSGRSSHSRRSKRRRGRPQTVSWYQACCGISTSRQDLRAFRVRACHWLPWLPAGEQLELTGSAAVMVEARSSARLDSRISASG